MITRLPSIQRSYDLVWSGDSAFIQLPNDATPEQRKAHEKKWEVARETGNYAELLVEGASPPTVFTMRQLTHDQTTVLRDMSRSPHVGAAEVNSLAFQAALQGVANLGDVEIKRDVFHPRLGLIVGSDFFEKAGVPPATSVAIVIELGDIVFEKMVALGKK